jgi:hypothetical protein
MLSGVSAFCASDPTECSYKQVVQKEVNVILEKKFYFRVSQNWDLGRSAG